MSTQPDGWEQVRAGLTLIECSKLAKWQPSSTGLTPADRPAFENAATSMHSEFGRVMAWILFSVGYEYVLKGACLIRNLITPQSKAVLRAPTSGENLATWVNDVLGGSNSVLEQVSTTGPLGKLPIKKLVQASAQPKLAQAAFNLLRDGMRNRDAHQYVKNVRAAHFDAVSQLFVPALNEVLRTLDQKRLRTEYPT